MSGKLIPASELPPASAAWVCDLTPNGRAALDRFLIQYAKQYAGTPVELERWIRSGVLDAFEETIRKGQTIGYVLRSFAARDGQDHTFCPARADVLCEAKPLFD